MDEERDYPIDWQEKTGRRRGETLIIANSGQIKSHRFDYQWRPAELADMCLYDFIQFAEKVQRNAAAIPDVTTSGATIFSLVTRKRQRIASDCGSGSNEPFRPSLVLYSLDVHSATTD